VTILEHLSEIAARVVLPPAEMRWMCARFRMARDEHAVATALPALLRVVKEAGAVDAIARAGYVRPFSALRLALAELEQPADGAGVRGADTDLIAEQEHLRVALREAEKKLRALRVALGDDVRKETP
jgi:hypothetical protein